VQGVPGSVKVGLFGGRGLEGKENIRAQAQGKKKPVGGKGCKDIWGDPGKMRLNGGK